jgi:hypothetical protein
MSFLPRLCVVLFVAALTSTTAVSATADDLATRKSPPKTITPELEKTVVAFVAENHPELKDVLTSLSRRRPRQYQMAMLELSRTRERLEDSRRRDPDRHALELEVWKLESRARLQSARLRMENSDELREELKRTLADHLAAQKKLLKRDRERIAQRLANVDRQLERLSQSEEILVERRLRQLSSGKGVGPGQRNRPLGDAKAPDVERNE